MLRYNKFLDPLLIATVALYLYIAPFTKVEESFNIQAIHDIINYGIYPYSNIEANYDHITFPGAVPRSFVGSLILATAIKVLNRVLSIVDLDLFAESSQLEVLKLVRGLLGITNILLLLKIRDSINLVSPKQKGRIGFFFQILLLSQFHILFYSSRTLPNFVILPVVSYSLSKLIQGDMSGLTWLAFSAIVFRLEIGILAVIVAGVSAAFRQSDLVVNIFMLVAGTLLGLAVSFSVDSYFWGQFLIPELVAFKYNVLSGNSSLWGVEPWYAYFKSYLPQLFRPPIILALLIPGFFSDPALEPLHRANKYTADIVTHPAKSSLKILFISSTIFVAIMSLQPHKEWRFIIYVVPVITLQAANGLSYIFSKRSRSIIYKIVLGFIFISVAFTTGLSLFSGYVSSFNYPGGEALEFVNEKIESENLTHPIVVHMDVATCMTGVNRFGELHNSTIIYDKSETEKDLLKVWDSIDILITENDYELASENANTSLESTLFRKGAWKLVHTVKAFERIDVTPWIKTFKAIKENPYSIKVFFVELFKELKQWKASSLLSIHDSTLIQKDRIYIYERAVKEIR